MHKVARIFHARPLALPEPQLLVRDAVKPRKVVMSAGAFTRLQRAAARRGLTVAELGEQIIETVARDNLVDAVLDDGGQL